MGKYFKMDSSGNHIIRRNARGINAPKKLIALIDVDPNYHLLFEDMFGEEAIVFTFFGLGREFMEIGSDEICKFDFVVINHTLFDVRIVPFLEKCREHILGKVCVISNDGNAVTDEERSRLKITGDFDKTDGEGLLGWFHCFSKEKVEA